MTQPTAPLSDLLPILQRELDNCRAHGNENATLVLSREMLERLVGIRSDSDAAYYGAME
jgi:hypothetical protein